MTEALRRSRRLEEALQGLVAQVVTSAPTNAANAAHRYFELVAAEDLVGREVRDLSEMITHHVSLAQVRPQGTARVQAMAPVLGRDGWYSPHTVVQVVTDDMPFLVDSVTAALSRANHSIHLVIHPIYMVKRDPAGNLLDVLIDEVTNDTTVPSGYSTESWMCFEVDRETDEADLREIEAQLGIVLADVRAAVQDWSRMRDTARETAQLLLNAESFAFEQSQREEASAFITWLTDDHFTFTGFAEYAHTSNGQLESVPGTGLGILRTDNSETSSELRSDSLLLVTKSDTRSLVHRSAYTDHVSLAKTNASGKVIGEYRFIGLYSSSAYTQSVFDIPMVSTKAQSVVDAFALGSESHSGKDLVQFLETYPRDQIFQATAQELEETARGVLQLQERRQVRIFVRDEVLKRYASVLVYFPRDRYNTDVRVKMEQVLLDTYGAANVDYTARLTDSVLARLHFEVRMPMGKHTPTVDIEALEIAMAHATRFWEDDFADELLATQGEEEMVRLIRTWKSAFPESFKEDTSAKDAVAHVHALEALESRPAGEISVALNISHDGSVGTRRFTIYRIGMPITLSSVLPMLHDMGIEVIDERAYDIRRAGAQTAWVYDFGIGFDESATPQPESLPQRFCETFLAAWAGEIESDGFNALVVHGGLNARNVAIIRAYSAYLRQSGTPFSQGYLQQVMRTNVGIVQLVLSLFQARFDPAFADDRESAEVELVGQIHDALDAVASLDHDRIMRASMALVRATLRTNVYQHGADGKPQAVMAFKLDPRRVPDLPLPLPMFEIWVFSPRVEGIHLRFATVARGGLRWSDRLEDFRTEVLGLVKAQMVKNTVIVPSGAKGGFVVKRGPDPSDRDAWLAEGIACYQMFIEALLDITDNLVKGDVVAPLNVVRHDSDDPYLVVAADKGTATFSDIANRISLDRGFWMGDAFASGGSIGYDHKAMGITARGAWESVKRHFLELGIDCQSQDFTAVGVGDMSGDVFGNGMLLSQHTKVLAAFDHRHIFLDPNPDVAKSFAERKRLFDLPRSSWEDYSSKLISSGGGIYARTLKSIPVTDQVRKALDIHSDAESMTASELISHILRANVDLLWNGGIGTYVKSQSETNAQVGDKANDGLRIDGNQLRAKVIGEGGNLGFTQLGRIEAARNGVKLNTDAIDNSAGVDTSDHEVNIKIMLDQAVISGALDADARNVLLASMTDEVGLQVLRDNYEQNVILEQSRSHADAMLRVHQRLMHGLEAQGLLNRSIEYLPSDVAIDALHSAGAGLTSPELAVLMAYVKIDVKSVRATDTLFDEEWAQALLAQYFPTPLREQYADLMPTHPLRRQIIATVLANDMVNHGGISFAWRAMEETGAGTSEVIRAYWVAREVFNFPGLWRNIEQLDGHVSTQCQTELYLESRRLLDRATRWFLQTRGGRLDVAQEIARFQTSVSTTAALIPDMLRGAERERFDNHAARLVTLGAPAELAARIAGLLDEFSLLDIIDIAIKAETEVKLVTSLYFSMSERFEVDRLLAHITHLPRDDRWASNARSALRSDLYAALAGLTARVVNSTPHADPVDARVSAWEDQFAEGVARTRATLGEIALSEQVDLATLSVALRAIRTLVGQGSH